MSFFVRGLSDEAAVGAGHKAAELGDDDDVIHAVFHQNLFVDLLYTGADFQDVVASLPWVIGNAHAAGEVDEVDMRAGLRWSSTASSNSSLASAG